MKIFVSLVLMVSRQHLVVSYSSHQVERAHKLSQYDQLVTSSHLGWLDHHRLTSEKIVMLGDHGVCRHLEAGNVVPGVLVSGQCLIMTDSGEVRWVSSGHETLVDIWGRARYDWRYWDMFRQPQIDTLAYTHKAGSIFYNFQHQILKITLLLVLIQLKYNYYLF